MKKFWYLANRIGRFFGGKREYPSQPKNKGAAFIVYNPAWPDPPQHWHGSLEEATKVAEMLSRQQPADDFYVMKALRVVCAKPETRELASGEV